jgi:hypothetical protein
MINHLVLLEILGIVMTEVEEMTEVQDIQEMTEVEEMTEVQDIQEMIEIPEMVEIENKQL